MELLERLSDWLSDHLARQRPMPPSPIPEKTPHIDRVLAETETVARVAQEDLESTQRYLETILDAEANLLTSDRKRQGT
jgi:hypothetical protein